MILWEHVNFWTAAGSICVGALLGLTIGWFVKQTKRLTLPPAVAVPRGGVCPACQTRTLRRLRCRGLGRLRAAATGRWPYGCSRCGWRSRLPIASTPRREPQREVSYPRPVKLEGRRGLPPSFDLHEPTTDEAAVEAAVLQHVQFMNLGDLVACVGGYAPGATNFGLDSGPRLAAGFLDHGTDILGGYERQSPIRVRDLRISIHKDAAVATGYLVGAVTMPNGGSRLVMGRSTFVHVRQDGAWKLAHSHLSPFMSEAPGSLH